MVIERAQWGGGGVNPTSYKGKSLNFSILIQSGLWEGLDIRKLCLCVYMAWNLKKFENIPTIPFWVERLGRN